MRIAITITYDVVTAASAADGAMADHGFASEDGELYSIDDDVFEVLEDKLGRPGAIEHQCTSADRVMFAELRACVNWLRDRGPLEASSAPLADPDHDWLTQIDSELGEPRFSYHLSGDRRCKRAVLRALGIEVMR